MSHIFINHLSSNLDLFHDKTEVNLRFNVSFINGQLMTAFNCFCIPLDRMLKALGEPMRLKIYQALLERKHCVRSLSKKFGISESAISQHMKVMKDAGLVYGEKYGYHTHYLPLQDAADYLAEQFELMRTASLTVDRDMTVCQCEYRKEGESK